ALARRPALDARDFLLGRSGLNVGPPLCESGIDFTGGGAQHQEIISSAEARMIQQAQRAPTFAALEAWLQADQLTQRQREPLGNRDARLLARCHLVASCEQMLRIAVWRVPGLRERALHGRPHQDREQECRRDGLLLAHALVSALQPDAYELVCGASRRCVL